MALIKVKQDVISDTVNLGRRNLIINGDMRVAQRSVASITGINGSGYYTVDRWNYNRDFTDITTQKREYASPPAGFKYYWKITVTTADTSITDGQNRIEQKIESSSLRHLEHGTSSAKSLTVSFWVKSNKTGDYSVGFYKDDLGATSSQAYTINTSDTWEYKTVTFAGDTSYGITSTEADAGLRVWFTLAASSNRTSGTANTWNTATTYRAVGQSVNLFDAVNNYFEITGVQVEVGDTATPFEHRSFGEELVMCQRYFCKSYQHDQAPGSSSQNGAVMCETVAAGELFRLKPFGQRFPQPMRGSPTVTLYDTLGNVNRICIYNNTSVNLTVSSAGPGGQNALNHFITVSTNAVAAESYIFQYTADAEM